ncbi:MAG: MBL fold metallo-hydrolase [Hyphomicrobiaceae bacterium]|nr:MBL fold metallo-hydrolase [Hyphomicrobiaceae bacterium]
MSMKVTILGCGASGGVPRIGGHWGNCDPTNLKNTRRRCSILVEKTSNNGTTRVLVDTSPDLRMQLIDAGIGEVDGVIYTHEHADHTHGVDDLRQVAFNKKQRTDVYMTKRVMDYLVPKFSYCFESPPDSFYPSILNAREMTAYKTFSIEGEGGAIDILPMDQHHGSILSMGFRFGDFTYSTDVNEFPDETAAALYGTKIWGIDALRYNAHKTHFNVETALSWIERIGPDQAFLTNMHHDLDYEALKAMLPENVSPSHDGLSFSINGIFH